MNIFGKLVAGAIGYMVAGVPGLLVGFFVGHIFDRGLTHSLSFGSPAQLQKVRQSFFETCFSLLGHVAKADGRVSAEEISQEKALSNLP